MANEPTIRGTANTYAPGWSQLFDHRQGVGKSPRVRVLMGPASSLDAVIVAARSDLSPLSVEPSVSPGSAVATLRLVYPVGSAFAPPPGDSRQPLYRLVPLMETVDLRAHPKAKSIVPHILNIEKHIAAGDLAALKTYIDGLDGDTKTSAAYFAALWVAGVQSFEAAAIQLDVTRWYEDPPSIADYADINRVYAWSAISTDGHAIPSYVREPKWRDQAGAENPFEWRLVSVSPAVQRDAENVVSWTFTGRQWWAKELYKGGTWEPQALW